MSDIFKVVDNDGQFIGVKLNGGLIPMPEHYRTEHQQLRSVANELMNAILNLDGVTLAVNDPARNDTQKPDDTWQNATVFEIPPARVARDEIHIREVLPDDEPKLYTERAISRVIADRDEALASLEKLKARLDRIEAAGNEATYAYGCRNVCGEETIKRWHGEMSALQYALDNEGTQ